MQVWVLFFLQGRGGGGVQKAQNKSAPARALGHLPPVYTAHVYLHMCLHKGGGPTLAGSEGERQWLAPRAKRTLKE